MRVFVPFRHSFSFTSPIHSHSFLKQIVREEDIQKKSLVLVFFSFNYTFICECVCVCIKFKVPTLTTNRRKRRKPICFKYQFYLSSQSKEKVYFIFRIFLFRSFTLIVSFCFEWTFNLQFNFSFLTSIFRYFISHNQKKKQRRSVMI